MHPGTRPRLWPSGLARAGTGWQGVGWAFVAAPTPPPLPGELAGVGKAGRGQLQLQAQHLSWTSKAFPIHPLRLLSESLLHGSSGETHRKEAGWLLLSQGRC